MKIFAFIFSFLLLTPVVSNAQAKIKFLSYIEPASGQRMPIWENFPMERRFHVAIQVNGYWYQMLPRTGFTKSVDFVSNDPLEIVRNKKTYRLLIETYVNPDLVLPDPVMKDWQYMKFDMVTAWEDPRTSNCSKCVGMIAGFMPIKPRHNGKNGYLYPVDRSLSPDDIFEIIKKSGDWHNPAVRVKSCNKVIKSKK